MDGRSQPGAPRSTSGPEQTAASVGPDRPGGAPAVYLLTGIQAAGKSTVAQLLAERLPRSVHVHGDMFRRWIVNGRADMTPDADADANSEAVRQLRLRHDLTARTCDAYAAAGFTVVAQDVLLGEHLTETITKIATRPLYVVVLAPRPEVVAERERARGKDAYDQWTISALDEGLRAHTPRVGLWIDTSPLTPAETVDMIVSYAPVFGVVPEPAPEATAATTAHLPGG